MQTNNFSAEFDAKVAAWSLHTKSGTNDSMAWRRVPPEQGRERINRRAHRKTRAET